jgi:hypothetical protein
MPKTPNLSNLKDRHPATFTPSPRGIGAPRGTTRNNTQGAHAKRTGAFSRRQCEALKARGHKE